MKRVKTITASTKTLKVSVKVTVESLKNHYTRDEVDAAVNSLASQIMREIPNMKYGYFWLSEIEIK